RARTGRQRAQAHGAEAARFGNGAPEARSQRKMSSPEIVSCFGAAGDEGSEDAPTWESTDP
ncbi:MAG TPA: hypothetical protein VGS58_08005, partial [Candidatus Sulfopaludibacter sp.]|nr:hypothetical protein [Candidatus Sulfopaludibacter sp.]